MFSITERTIIFEPVLSTNSLLIATSIGFSGIDGTSGFTDSLGAVGCVGFDTEGIPAPPDGITIGICAGMPIGIPGPHFSSVVDAIVFNASKTEESSLMLRPSIDGCSFTKTVDDWSSDFIEIVPVSWLAP